MRSALPLSTCLAAVLWLAACGKPADGPLPKSLSLSGVVKDESGAPVPGALVVLFADTAGTAQPPAAYEPAPAISRADGTFTFEQVPGADYVVLADRRTPPGAPSERGSARVSLRANATGVEVRLRKLLDLLGDVVDSEGKPVAGVEVDVEAETPRPEDPGEQQLHAVTNAEGRFVLRGLSPMAYSLRLQSPELYPVPLKQLTPGGEALKLSVERCAAVHAKVVDPEGTPLTQLRFNGEIRDLAAGAFHQPICDDLEAFPALKDRLLHFSAPNFVPRSVPVNGLRRGQRVDLGTLKLDRPRGLRVNVVEASGGAPVVAPDVRVVAPSLEQVTARFTKKGEVRVDGLPPGVTTLTLAVPGFIPAEVTVPGGDAAATARLSRGLSIRGVVKNGAGLPAGNQKLRVVGTDSEQELSTDAAGRFTASGLKPGPVRVVMGGQRFGAQAISREQVEDVRHAVAGDTAELEVRPSVAWQEVTVKVKGGTVERAVVVAGQQKVDDSVLRHGEPWPLAEGAAREAWLASHPWGDPGVDVAGIRTAREVPGGLDFGRLGNGRYTLLARSKDGRTARVPFEVEEGPVALAVEFGPK
ncbi:MAG: hypothetical protein RL653_1577 [Pseudomonadota bacterium]|jgi:protocatechuate 3,4-dioxygenase beta subunit